MGTDPVGTRDTSLKIRITTDDLDRWRTVAALRTVSLAELIRSSVEVAIAQPHEPAATRRRSRTPPAAVVECSRSFRHIKGLRCPYCRETP